MNRQFILRIYSFKYSGYIELFHFPSAQSKLLLIHSCFHRELPNEYIAIFFDKISFIYTCIANAQFNTRNIEAHIHTQFQIITHQNCTYVNKNWCCELILSWIFSFRQLIHLFLCLFSHNDSMLNDNQTLQFVHISFFFCENNVKKIYFISITSEGINWLTCISLAPIEFPAD